MSCATAVCGGGHASTIIRFTGDRIWSPFDLDLHDIGEYMKANTMLRAAGLLLLATMAWGGLFPVAMVTLPVLDPFYMTAIRYGATAAIFMALLAGLEGKSALSVDGRGARAAWLGSLGFA